MYYSVHSELIIIIIIGACAVPLIDGFIVELLLIFFILERALIGT